MIEISKKSLYIFFAVFLGLIILGSASFFYFFKDKNYNFLIPSKENKFVSLEYGSQPALEDENYFRKIHNQFVDEKISFIEADLTNMKLRLYDDGNLTQEFEIKAKGKEGAWWETPAGIYKIESREKTHYSSFGKVYQPWSMAFQGNFFVHGWPYYPDGSPVASSYSGGCIRLSTEDSEKVFNWAKVGTPILVYKKSFDSDGFKYEKKRPEISANNYLAVDLKNNFVFLEKSSKDVVPMASLTKLLTALVSIEYINIEKEITVQKDAIVPTSKPRLKVGDSISLFNLLHPLLLESSNEAAIAIADYLGQNHFINLMNLKAKAIGMKNTYVFDPAGIDEKNVSTAEDLFNLTRYIYNNRSFIFKLTIGKLTNNAYGVSSFSNLENFNGFDGNSEFVGGKVGQTEAAKKTIISVFEINIQGEKRPVAIIALGSDDNFGDVEKILNWIKANY